MIWHGLLGRKIAEHTNPSNILYNSLSSYFVEFFWKTGLWILVFKCDIYGRVFSRPWSDYDNLLHTWLTKAMCHLYKNRLIDWRSKSIDLFLHKLGIALRRIRSNIKMFSTWHSKLIVQIELLQCFWKLT